MVNKKYLLILVISMLILGVLFITSLYYMYGLHIIPYPFKKSNYRFEDWGKTLTVEFDTGMRMTDVVRLSTGSQINLIPQFIRYDNSTECYHFQINTKTTLGMRKIFGEIYNIDGIAIGYLRSDLDF